jgi:hypothetical protein
VRHSNELRNADADDADAAVHESAIVDGRPGKAGIPGPPEGRPQLR